MTRTPSAVLETGPFDQDVEEVPPQTGSVRVLHVEDNPADAALIQAYIRGVSSDIEFDTVSCLADITAERAITADCAILDLSLPDATGLQGLIALRGMAEALPIVVLTGFDDLPLGLTALKSGAEDYLVKNHVDGYTLQRAIRYAIERRRLSIKVADSASAHWQEMWRRERTRCPSASMAKPGTTRSGVSCATGRSSAGRPTCIRGRSARSTRCCSLTSISEGSFTRLPCRRLQERQPLPARISRRDRPSPGPPPAQAPSLLPDVIFSA